MTGTVKRVIAEKGFGFILGADGQEYFFHGDDLQDSTIHELQPASSVEFRTEKGKPGKGPRARSVQLVGAF